MPIPTDKSFRYALYARKSSEGDERQIQSIDSQSARVRELSLHRGKVIAVPFVESRSAKEPGRPEFNRMLAAIDAGQVDGILAWHPDRLSRNELDAAAITWRLRKGILKDLDFVEFFFHNSPEGIMMLQNALSQSQYQVSKLSIDVTRGMQDKIKLGWYPHRAPLGYLNNVLMRKGAKTIGPDPERFPLMRKAWDLLLTGAYTVPQIARIMNEQWGFRTPLSERSGKGGRTIVVSTLYRCFHNPFYSGMFLHAGTLHKGAHEPMVTATEFKKAQAILGLLEAHLDPNERPAAAPARPRAADRPYLGLIRCGSCAGVMTATTVTKPSGKQYTYYHCSRGQGTCRKRCLREERLEEMIDQELSHYDLPEEFHDWSVEFIEEGAARDEEAQAANRAQRLRALKDTDTLLDGLIDLGMRGLVTDEQYRAKQATLTMRRETLRQELEAVDQARELAKASSRNVLNYVANARNWLRSDDVSIKRIVARNLGSNYVLTNGNLLLEPHPMLERLRRNAPTIIAEYRRIKLAENGSQSTKKATYMAIHSSWSGMWEAVQTMSIARSLSFPDVAGQITTAMQAASLLPIVNEVKRLHDRHSRRSRRRRPAKPPREVENLSGEVSGVFVHIG